MADQTLHTKALWKEFSGHVRAFIRQRVSNDADAEDVLQDIFIRIHQGIDSLRDQDKVQSWVFGIARRALADYYRKKGRDREEASGPAVPGAESSDSHEPILNEFDGDHDVHEEVLSWLIPMIEELPEKYRVPLKMADVQGKTQQEVADDLGLSLSGAKSRVQRAREKLGEVLAECCEVEFGEEGRAVAYRKVKEDNCEEC